MMTINLTSFDFFGRQVLEDKYEASKKAMNDVLWKVLPTYTEDFNQLPPMTNLPSIETTIYLGDYEILEIIGEGRFAAVRACRYHPPTVSIYKHTNVCRGTSKTPFDYICHFTAFMYYLPTFPFFPPLS